MTASVTATTSSAIWLAWTFAWVLMLASSSHAGGAIEANVIFHNWSPGPVAIYWLHPKTKEPHLMQAALPSHSNTHFNSFSGHSFEIREVPDPETGTCGSREDQTCSVGYVAVTSDETQTVQILEKMKIETLVGNADAPPNGGADTGTGSRDASEVDLSYTYDKQNDPNSVNMDHCRQHLPGSFDGYIGCLNRKAASSIRHWNDEVFFQEDLRVVVSDQMENVTCLIADLPSSPDVEVRQWTSERDGVTRPVHVKLDRPASRIHLVQNFASPDECQAMEDAAQPKLHHATVADGKGGSRQSENRKAMQAGISPKWQKEAEGDLVATLSRRVYDYANHVLPGLNLTHFGQENLMSIQYFGRGYNDTTPDRYTPHCDGNCKGVKHQHGARMATMVIYCTLPEHGGHTNFQKANVHVKPEPGAAVFFSYIDPDTRVTDNELTEHSGCPIYEGEKKIVTQWIRHGVDGRSPWTSFNTRKHQPNAVLFWPGPEYSALYEYSDVCRSRSLLECRALS